MNEKKKHSIQAAKDLKTLKLDQYLSHEQDIIYFPFKKSIMVDTFFMAAVTNGPILPDPMDYIVYFEKMKKINECLGS